MLHRIENEKIILEVSSIGATITKFIDKKTGTDIVLGFDDEADYTPSKSPYFGTTVARNANRIGESKFELNGVTYNLVPNNGPNNLHSNGGTCFKEFNLVSKTNTSLEFDINMLDGEDGFPGNLKLTVIYELIDNKLKLTYKGLADKDTIFNVTNHSYFNLNGGISDVRDHEVQIYTDKVALNDSNGMASDKVINVNGTSFDFTTLRKVGPNFDLKHENLASGGIDHNYVFENMNFKKLITIKDGSLSLTVSSDLPGVQVYTACTIGDIKGKRDYHSYYGIAIEPQFYPNSINYSDILKPIIKANNCVIHTIEYLLED